MEVIHLYDKIPYRSRALKSRLGDAWIDFFRNLPNPNEEIDRAILVTTFAGVLRLRPGSSRYKEGDPDSWESPFTILLRVDAHFQDYLDELNELVNAEASPRAIRLKEQEYIKWCNDSLLEAFEMVNVQKAFHSKYSGTLRIYQMAYDDPFEEGETQMLRKVKV